MVLVLQTILCCILLTVALVARQSGPERFAAFGSGLGELLEGDGKSLLEQLEGSPAEEFLAHLLSREKAEGQDARQPDPAQEEGQEPDGEEPLDFDWEEAGQLLEEPAGSVAAVMGRATLWIGGLQMPVAGALTSPYGYRIHPITEKRGFHSGVDLAAGWWRRAATRLMGNMLCSTTAMCPLSMPIAAGRWCPLGTGCGRGRPLHWWGIPGSPPGRTSTLRCGWTAPR